MTAPGLAHGVAPQKRPGPPHTFVCYARADSSFVLPLTIYLRARGIPIWMDADIPPGADWDSNIDEQLRTCSSFLLVMSPAAAASAEVRGELRRALNQAKPIIPVLYQPCDIPRQLLNVQYLDFSSETNVDASRDALAVVLESTNRDLPPRDSAPRLDGRDLRNRRDFLEDVQLEAAGRSAQSLAAGRLTVKKEKQPAQVARVWDTEIKIPDQQRIPLGSDIGIVDVFDD
ncbi:MAG: toll/interleukin-1 receptor domain-containing protein, partial [Vicinamibacterales bacterium]